MRNYSHLQRDKSLQDREGSAAQRAVAQAATAPCRPSGFAHFQERFHTMRPVPNSLHDEAASRLREQIFAGALPPGSFLDEAALCERLAISRTPLREALKVLTAEGLLRHEPRRGCFVSEVTEADLDDIFPVIALLEGRCAHEAAARVTQGDLRALEGLARAGHVVAQQQRPAAQLPRQRVARAFFLQRVDRLQGVVDLAHAQVRVDERQIGRHPFVAGRDVLQ